MPSNTAESFDQQLERCSINELPNEILSYIFELGTHAEEGEEHNEASVDDEWETDDEGDASMTDAYPDTEVVDVDEDEKSLGMPEHDPPPPFTVLVSHVCRKWRECAIGTPNLWSKIDFAGDREPFTRTRAWLERSRGVPIDINLDTEHDDDGFSSSEDEDSKDHPRRLQGWSLDEFTLAMSLILPHVSRWRSLEIHVTEYAHIHRACAEMGACAGAPLLESMQLIVHEETEQNNTFEPEDLREPRFVLFSGHAPKLSEVSLWGVHLDWERSSSYLEGLADFEMAWHTRDVRPTFKQLSTILKNSPNIQTLALCQSGPAGETKDEWLESFSDEDIRNAAAAAVNDASGSVVMLNLPTLRNLNLAYHEPEYATLLLEHISVPGLEGLVLDFDADDYTVFAQALIAANSSTGHAQKHLLRGLEELKVSGLPCHDGTAAALLSQLSNLRSINLNFHYVDLVWLSFLANKPGTTTPVVFEDLPATPTAWSAAFLALTSAGESNGLLSQGLFCPRLESFTAIGLTGGHVRWLAEQRRILGAPLKAIFVDDDTEVSKEDEAWLRANLNTFGMFENSDDEDDDGDLVMEEFFESEDGEEID